MQNGPSEAGYTPGVILLTGGAGFIGSHVATALVQRHPLYKVVVLDRLDYCASTRNLEAAEAAAGGRLKLVRGDVLAADLVQYVLESEGVDTVMHFAAQTHVDASFFNSLSFTRDNTYGTHVLLEACRAYGRVRRFIYVSTDEVFGAAEEQAGEVPAGLPDSTSLAPGNPYAAAKAAAELMAAAYCLSYRLPVIITRSNNVYGPGQFPEKLVPKFILLASRGAKLPVHGSAGGARSYLFVDDVVEAFDLVLHKGEAGLVYNIGSQRQRSALNVAADVCSLFRLPAEAHIAHVPDRAFNDRRCFASDPKLAALGWSERTPWEAGLRRTVDWYLQHAADWWDAGKRSLLPLPLLK
ncbi:hypothetical protein ABPG75_004383 [Micractinium tetrahymenae]